MSETNRHEIKESLKKMAAGGVSTAAFGKLENANFFKHLLELKGVRSKIEEKLGHARTVDTRPEVLLHKHFLVTGMDTAAKKVLGKFV